MIRLLPNKRFGPIGVDVGARSVKLVQLSADHSKVIDAVRWDWNPGGAHAKADRDELITSAIKLARAGRRFRGHDAVLALTDGQVFLQNIRVAKSEAGDLHRLVHQEATSRLPFPINQAEVRFIEAADVRHGETALREVILVASQRTSIDKSLTAVENAGLRPIAVDIEPMALLRSYRSQFRRDEDRDQRALIVHVGHSRTAAVIARGDAIVFIKYIDVGGQHLDTAVAELLEMEPSNAAALRRNNGDRRAEQQDAEVARSVAEAVRPVLERLANELAMCVRYHSVTFRGMPLQHMLLGGGEATPQLAEFLGERVSLKCHLSNALRAAAGQTEVGRSGQWDVAVGLALRDAE